MRFLTALLPLLAVCAEATHHNQPDLPGLTFLYTAYVDCTPNIEIGSPNGARVAIPIVGGNFTGPRLKGKILNLGADWGTTGTDNIFHADTRYHLQTEDKANIYIRTSGPAQPNGNLHLRMEFETGFANYTWLNNIVAIGVLSPVVNTAAGFTLRIDAWHLAIPKNTTAV